MDTNTLLAAIDEEIQTLQQVRALLSGGASTGKKKVGRPATHFDFGANKPKKKRVLSAEAREKIAAAQRKRWAVQKKTAKKAA